MAFPIGRGNSFLVALKAVKCDVIRAKNDLRVQITKLYCEDLF
jgi:hypothetical protein